MSDVKARAEAGRRDIPVMGRAALLANKRASGSPKDIADVDWLENDSE